MSDKDIWRVDGSCVGIGAKLECTAETTEAQNEEEALQRAREWCLSLKGIAGTPFAAVYRNSEYACRDWRDKDSGEIKEEWNKNFVGARH